MANVHDNADAMDASSEDHATLAMRMKGYSHQASIKKKNNLMYPDPLAVMDPLPEARTRFPPTAPYLGNRPVFLPDNVTYDVRPIAFRMPTHKLVPFYQRLTLYGTAPRPPKGWDLPETGWLATTGYGKGQTPFALHHDIPVGIALEEVQLENDQGVLQRALRVHMEEDRMAADEKMFNKFRRQFIRAMHGTLQSHLSTDMEGLSEVWPCHAMP